MYRHGESAKRKPNRALVTSVLATGAVLLGAGGAFGSSLYADLNKSGLLADINHATNGQLTPQEHKLTDTANFVFDTKAVIHCSPIKPTEGPQSNERSSGKEKIRAFIHRDVIDGVSFVRVSPDVCDDALLPTTKEELSEDEKMKSAMAIEAITHEIEHDLHPEASEGLTECYAIQDSYRLGRMLGMPMDKADELASIAAKLQPFHAPKAYQVPDGCYDGGKYDLHPDQKGGDFPITGNRATMPFKLDD